MPQEIIRGADGIPIESRSGLEAASCGFRYNELYNKGVQDDSPYSRRGSAYHAVKRLYILKLADAKLSADLELAREAFEAGIATSMTPPEIVPEVWGIWERHMEHFQLDLDRYIAAEEKRIRLQAPVPYQYQPDLEYASYHAKEIETVDDKSYYSAFTEAQAAELLQTKFYTWAAMQEYPGFEYFKFTYNFVRLNRTVSVQFTRTDHEAGLNEMIAAMALARRQRYAEQNWDAVPGEACRFCHLACPVFRTDSPLSYDLINSQETFHKAAGLKIVAEKRLTALNDALKAYVKAYGPQTVNGETFAFKPVTERSYPGQAVVDAVRKLGEEPSFRVSYTALKPMFKRIGGLEEDLAPVMIAKDKPRFGHASLKASLIEAGTETEGSEE